METFSQAAGSEITNDVLSIADGITVVGELAAEGQSSLVVDIEVIEAKRATPRQIVVGMKANRHGDLVAKLLDDTGDIPLYGGPLRQRQGEVLSSVVFSRVLMAEDLASHAEMRSEQGQGVDLVAVDTVDRRDDRGFDPDGLTGGDGGDHLAKRVLAPDAVMRRRGGAVQAEGDPSEP